MFFPPAFYPTFAPANNNNNHAYNVSQGIPLALHCDAEHLSEYQMAIRQHLELFAATPQDCESNTQGRKRAVVLGQVGLRCRHCRGAPLRSRGRGAVYYPAKLTGVYQAAQNMAQSHLTGACQHLGPQVKEELQNLRNRRDNASGGKQYWADGCRALGVYEVEGQGLKLQSNSNNNNNTHSGAAPQPPQQPPPAAVPPPKGPEKEPV